MSRLPTAAQFPEDLLELRIMRRVPAKVGIDCALLLYVKGRHRCSSPLPAGEACAGEGDDQNQRPLIFRVVTMVSPKILGCSRAVPGRFQASLSLRSPTDEAKQMLDPTLNLG